MPAPLVRKRPTHDGAPPCCLQPWPGSSPARPSAHYYHIADPSQIAVRIIHGGLLTDILKRTPPDDQLLGHIRTDEYDSLPPS